MAIVIPLVTGPDSLFYVDNTSERASAEGARRVLDTPHAAAKPVSGQVTAPVHEALDQTVQPSASVVDLPAPRQHAEEQLVQTAEATTAEIIANTPLRNVLRGIKHAFFTRANAKRQRAGMDTEERATFDAWLRNEYRYSRRPGVVNRWKLLRFYAESNSLQDYYRQVGQLDAQLSQASIAVVDRAEQPDTIQPVRATLDTPASSAERRIWRPRLATALLVGAAALSAAGISVEALHGSGTLERQTAASTAPAAPQNGEQRVATAAQPELHKPPTRIIPAVKRTVTIHIGTYSGDQGAFGYKEGTALDAAAEVLDLTGQQHARPATVAALADVMLRKLGVPARSLQSGEYTVVIGANGALQSVTAA